MLVAEAGVFLRLLLMTFLLLALVEAFCKTWVRTLSMLRLFCLRTISTATPAMASPKALGYAWLACSSLTFPVVPFECFLHKVLYFLGFWVVCMSMPYLVTYNNCFIHFFILLKNN